MKFVIQSFSDIITNSSSEVFISAPNEDFLYEKWKEDEIEIPLEQWVESLPESFLFSEYQQWDGCRNFIEGYSITAKDPKNSKAADLLTSLDSIFTTDVSYG